MIINHNIGAMTACRYMNINLALANKAMQRLSSGRRINSAADDDLIEKSMFACIKLNI